MEEGEWVDVRRRKTGSSSNSENLQQQSNITTFFFTNFPEDWSNARLKAEFKGFGRLVDIYVAKKKTLDGKCFGFLRYAGIRNPISFVRLLNGIPIGNLKVKVNIARFNRGKSLLKKPNLPVTVPSRIQAGMFRSREAVVTPGRSFADILKGDKNNQESQAISISSPPEATTWLCSNLIGKVRNFETLHQLANLMEADGCGEVRLRYIGGLSVLLDFGSKEKADLFLVQAKVSWSIWFIELNFWSPTTNPNSRIASLIVTGLPPQAWSSEAFSLITNSLGDSLIQEECGLDNSNLAAGRIVVLTNRLTLINDVKRVIVDGVDCSIRISEDHIDSWNHMPKFPSTKLTDFFGYDEEDKVTMGSKDFSSSEVNANDDDYISDTPAETEGSASPTPEKSPGVSPLVEQRSGNGSHVPQSSASLAQNVVENPLSSHSAPLEGDREFQDEPIHNYVTGSIDLNRPINEPQLCASSTSFFTPRSFRRQKAMADRREGKSVGSQSHGSVSVEVQNTIAVGNMVGFEMNGLETEIRDSLVAERGFNGSK